MSVARPRLRRLARACGIADGYVAADGARRATSDATRVRLLAAMGIDAASEASADAACTALARERAARWIEPVAVTTAARAARLVARAPRPWRGRTVDWQIRIAPAPGEHAEVTAGAVSDAGATAAPTRGRARIGPDGRLRLPLPPLACGTHALHLALRPGAQPEEPVEARQWLLAQPPQGRCQDVRSRLGQERAFGIWTHFYQLVRADDFGIGDLSHLRELLAAVARAGGAFVATQPLHALANRTRHASPYSPVSRLYRNPIYLDLGALPDLAECPEAAHALAGLQASGRLAALRSGARIDYEGVLHVKRRVLEPLHRHFRARHGCGGTARGRAFRDWVASEGTPLRDFSTHQALADRFGGSYRPAHDWRRWPRACHDPRSAEVQRFAEREAGELDFHAWLQFEFDRQLARSCAPAGEHAPPLGVMGDLAIGCDRASADVWAQRALFVDGANLGAPPDAFADGQDWSLPPLQPARARADGHAYLRGVLRSAFRHMGALRIDHVMGLFRQFWVPAGRPPAEGAYVAMPARELLALLAIESHRSGAVVVGEDLGTRPPALAPRLARAGILSMRVLPFERKRDGSFRPAAAYGDRACVMAHTHDLPPLRGWCLGRDLWLRRQAGELDDDARFAAEVAARCAAVAALGRRLRRDGLLAADLAPAGPDLRASDAPRRADPSAEDTPPAPPDDADTALAAAVTAFLAATSSPLLALSLDDLAAAVDPINLPAAPDPHARNWTRRLREPVDVTLARAHARAQLAAVPPARRA